MASTQAEGHKTDIRWINAAKGISIILVVHFHSAYWLGTIGINGDLPLRISDALAEMRMPVFFFAAGLLATKYASGTWQRVVTRKVVVLAWAFFVWQIINIGYSFVAGMLIFQQPFPEALLKSLVSPLLALVRPSDELWFLWALCIMFALAKLATRLPRRIVLCVVLAAAVALNGLGSEVTTQIVGLLGLGWMGLGRYFIFFLAGSWLTTRFAKRLEALPIPVAVVAAILFFSVIVVSRFFNPGPLNFIFTVCGLLAGISIARTLAGVGWLRTIGRNTLPIYVMHTTFLVAIAISIEYAIAVEAVEGWGYLLAIAMAGIVVAATYGSACALRRLGASWLFTPPQHVVDRVARAFSTLAT